MCIRDSLSSLKSIDSIPATLFSCVGTAITGFTQSETPKDSLFSIQIACEFDWTNVPYRGKSACDGPRFKAIGNSMAVNVMSFLGQRIQFVEDMDGKGFNSRS